MLTPSRFLLVLTVVALGCDDGSDLRGPPPPPTAIPPQIGHAPDSGPPPSVGQAWDDAKAGKPSPVKPVITWVEGRRPLPAPEGSVELVQQRLDLNPQMGPCPVWGAPVGSGWTQVFRHTFPLPEYPEGQPNNCQQAPPQSHYPNLWASGNTYPSGWMLNDNINAFFVWANYLECVRVKFWQHPNTFAGGGYLATYQVCGSTNEYGYAWSGNLSSDAGFAFYPSQMSVERWTY
jgi:hypothetical protein